MTYLEILLLILAIFGGVNLAGGGLKYLFSVIPILSRFRSKVFGFAYDRLRIKNFKKNAITYNIEWALNQSIFPMKKYLPHGWLKRVRIEWVGKTKRSFLKDGDIILRIRPSSTIEESLLAATWAFYGSVIFPNNRDIVPTKLLASSSLAITRAGISESHPHLVDEFDTKFVRGLRAQDKLDPDAYSDCIRLNECGFLMGPFVRELDRAADTLRLEGRIEAFSQTISPIFEHLLSFQPIVRHAIPEDKWACYAPYGSYGLILVSKPPEIRPDPTAYAKRAKETINKGVERIYIVGRVAEREFYNDVVSAILSLRELKGLETFQLYRDYRGDPGGICIVVGVDPVLLDINPAARLLDDKSTPDFVSEVPDAVLADDERNPVDKLEKTISKLIVGLSNFDGEWINLSKVGEKLRDTDPQFTPQLFGEKNLYSVLRKMKGLQFFKREDLSGPTTVLVKNANGDSSSVELDQQILKNARENIVAVMSEKEGKEWVFLSRVGVLLKTYMPDFSYQRFGYKSLSSFIDSIEELEVQRAGENNSIYVRARK